MYAEETYVETTARVTPMTVTTDFTDAGQGPYRHIKYSPSGGKT